MADPVTIQAGEAFDPGLLPVVLPPSVQRTTDDGLPTKALLDWEELTRNAYKTFLTKTQSSLFDVTSQTNDAFAQVKTTITAMTSDTEALASLVTQVTATVGQNKADAHQELLSYVGPGGATAQQITALTATVDQNKATAQNNLLAYVGPNGSTSAFITNVATRVDNNFTTQQASLNVVAQSVNGVAVQFGVTGYIDGTTGGFVFTGVKQNNGTVAYNTIFNSNVTINGGLLVNGTVDFSQMAGNSATNAFGASGYSGGTITAQGTARTNARLIIVATVSRTEGTFDTAPLNNVYTRRNFNVFLNGGNIGAVQTADVLTGFFFNGGSSYTFYRIIAPASAIFVADVGPGTQTVQITSATGQPVDMGVACTVLQR
jgi:hypothetical protein